MPYLMSGNRLLIGVLLIALLLRLTVFYAVDIIPVSDALDYIQLAQELVKNHQFSIQGESTAYRLPGYPFFLAGLFTITESIRFVQIIQIILDVLSCLFIYKIARTVTSDRKSIIACLLWAIFPSAIIHTLLILTETFFTTFFLLSFLLFIHNEENESSHKYMYLLILGITWGICCLIKPFMVLAPLCFIAISIQKNKKVTNTALVKAGIAFIGIVCITAPWMMRNYSLFGTTSLSSNGGVNFWIGNNPTATGTYYYPQNNPLDSISDEFERSKYGYDKGMDFILHNPVKTAVLAVKKVGYLFSLESSLIIATVQSDELYSKKTSYRTLYRNLPFGLLLLFNLPYCIIIISGIIGLCQRTNMLLPILYFVLFWVFIHIVYFAQNRFHFPLLPLFIVAAVSLSKKYNMTRISTLSSAVLICAFLSIIAAEIYAVWLMG